PLGPSGSTPRRVFRCPADIQAGDGGRGRETCQPPGFYLQAGAGSFTIRPSPVVGHGQPPILVSRTSLLPERVSPMGCDTSRPGWWFLVLIVLLTGTEHASAEWIQHEPRDRVPPIVPVLGSGIAYSPDAVLGQNYIGFGVDYSFGRVEVVG